MHGQVLPCEIYSIMWNMFFFSSLRYIPHLLITFLIDMGIIYIICFLPPCHLCRKQCSQCSQISLLLKFKLLAWFSFEISWVNSNVFVSDKVEDEEVFDGKILQYCSIDKKGKKSLGELEQDFLQALQVILHCISMLYIAIVFFC